METIEILKVIKKYNPSHIPRDESINNKIINELEGNDVNSVRLNWLDDDGYIKCKIKWSWKMFITQWIWLTDKWRKEIEKYEWLEAENRDLKNSTRELEKQIKTENSFLRHPLFVWISTAIVIAFLTYIITK